MSFLLLTYLYFLLPTEVVVTSGSINKATLSIPKVGTVVDFKLIFNAYKIVTAAKY